MPLRVLVHSFRIVRLAKTDVLLLDDWGLEKLNLGHRNDLLELMEDRHRSKSTIITSQLPVKEWHSSIDDPTLADAIVGLDSTSNKHTKLITCGDILQSRVLALRGDHLGPEQMDQLHQNTQLLTRETCTDACKTINGVRSHNAPSTKVFVPPVATPILSLSHKTWVL